MILRACIGHGERGEDAERGIEEVFPLFLQARKKIPVKRFVRTDQRGIVHNAPCRVDDQLPRHIRTSQGRQ